jgi:putative addiction module component (TIGR02574 family)
MPMTEAVRQLRVQAAALSPVERADFALYLLTTLDPEEEGAAEAWRAEIARRVTAIRGGTAAGRPVDELLAELREQYP